MKKINRVAAVGKFRLTIIDITDIYERLIERLPPLEHAKRKRKRRKEIENELKVRVRNAVLRYYAGLQNYLVCNICTKSDIVLGLSKGREEVVGDVAPLVGVYNTHANIVAKEMRVSFLVGSEVLSRYETQRIFELPSEVLDSILLGLEMGWRDEDIAKDLEVDLRIVYEIKETIRRNLDRWKIFKFEFAL